MLIVGYMYKINRYCLPLLEIVFVTSTKLIFLIVFVYSEYKREENFTWALEKLKELFTSEKLFSKVMVTDRELAMINALIFNSFVVFVSYFQKCYYEVQSCII